MFDIRHEAFVVDRPVEHVARSERRDVTQQRRSACPPKRPCRTPATCGSPRPSETVDLRSCPPFTQIMPVDDAVGKKQAVRSRFRPTKYAGTSRESAGSSCARTPAYRQSFGWQDRAAHHRRRVDSACKPNRDLQATGRSRFRRLSHSNSSHRVAHNIPPTLCWLGRWPLQ
jgi:hypothetical protein